MFSTIGRVPIEINNEKRHCSNALFRDETSRVKSRQSVAWRRELNDDRSPSSMFDTLHEIHSVQDEFLKVSRTRPNNRSTVVETHLNCAQLLSRVLHLIGLFHLVFETISIVEIVDGRQKLAQCDVLANETTSQADTEQTVCVHTGRRASTGWTARRVLSSVSYRSD
jgi:hypothetical protein